MKIIKKTERVIYYAGEDGFIYSKVLGSTQEAKRLSLLINKDGYYVCSIGVVHRLVATCFIDNPENKPMVNHRNGNKLDNRPLNLEWATSYENNTHAFVTGLNRSKKLTDSQVLEIIEKYGTGGYSSRALAKEYGVSDRMIMRYVRGKERKHIGVEGSKFSVSAGRPKKDYKDLSDKIALSLEFGMQRKQICMELGISKGVYASILRTRITGK